MTGRMRACFPKMAKDTWKSDTCCRGSQATQPQGGYLSRRLRARQGPKLKRLVTTLPGPAGNWPGHLSFSRSGLAGVLDSSLCPDFRRQ